MADQILTGQLFPVLFGTAKFDIGIEELMDAITQWMPRAKGDSTPLFQALCIKWRMIKPSEDLPACGFSMAAFKQGMRFSMPRRERKKRSARSGNYRDKNRKTTVCLLAGDSAVLCGMNRVKAGDIIGKDEGIHNPVNLHAPLLTVQVTTENPEDFPALVNALQILIG